MKEVLSKLLGFFKKPLVKWVSGALIALAAGVLGMKSGELQKLICEAEVPALEAPAPAPPVPEVK